MTETAIPPDLRALLHRAPAAPPLPFPPGAGGGLARGRVHEFCGPARHTLAVIAAGGLSGPILWIRPRWQAERLYSPGLAGFLDPSRLICVDAPRPVDILWAAEEALRAGVLPVVIAELPEPPGLTPVRRLHLAATEGGGLALGLLLVPGDGRAAGIESRWHLAPAHRGDDGLWDLSCLRRRGGAAGGVWRLCAAGPRDGGRNEVRAVPRQAPAPSLSPAPAPCP